jgi:hypothetical protein
VVDDGVAGDFVEVAVGRLPLQGHVALRRQAAAGRYSSIARGRATDDGA